MERLERRHNEGFIKKAGKPAFFVLLYNYTRIYIFKLPVPELRLLLVPLGAYYPWEVLASFY